MTSADIQAFFQEFNIQDGKDVTDGTHNLSVDGTGIKASVDRDIAMGIKRYIQETSEQSIIDVLDIGAGIGFLTFFTDEQFRCYAMEGSAQLKDHVVADKDRYCICDLSQPFTDHRLYRAFDLTTSFEVIEHIHPNDRDVFFKNLRFLSQRHLCSVHNLPPAGSADEALHPGVMPLEAWLEYFSKINANVTIIDDFATRIGAPWECSYYFSILFLD